MCSIYTTRRILVLGTLFLVALCCGCNEEPITNVYISEPVDTYTLSGRVLSFPDNLPVAGAEYTILSGNLSGTCDDDGNFQEANLSRGTYQLLISAPGHSPSRITMSLPATYYKSNIHQHQNFYLIENSSTLDLTVRGQEAGDILPGVTVAVSAALFPDGIHGHQIDTASLPAGGQTDENGKITLTGLPSSAVWISAMPYDADGDGKYDYGSQYSQFLLNPQEATTGHMVMSTYTGDAPELIATNLPDGYSPTLVAPSLYFLFSVPMDPDVSKTQVTLRQDNNPYLELPVTATWTSPIRLEVTPIEPLSNPNMDYDFFLTTSSVDGMAFSTYRYSMYWQTGSEVGGGDCDEVVTDLVAESQGGSAIDFDTRNIMLTWSAVSCAGGYRIYARDDRNNTRWVYLKDEPTDYETGTITTVCTLPSSFDRYEVDGIQTPFAGTAVEFCVVPKFALTPAPGTPHGTATVTDGQVPSLIRVSQTGDGLNTTGGTLKLEFAVVFSEFIDPSVGDPVIEIKEMGGDPAFTLDPADATWIWHAGRFSGRFVFDFPDGANASGDHYRITINDLADLSGNTVAGPTMSDWQVIEVWGGLFNFESSPQGWSQTGEGWEWGTPTIGPAGAHDGLRCWGVTLDSEYGDSWNTDLTSPDIFVPGVNPVLGFWCWYYTDYYDDYVRVYADNGTTEVELAAFHGSLTEWTLMSYDLRQFAGQKIRLRFNFSSDSYGTYPGFFLDDVAVFVNSK